MENGLAQFGSQGLSYEFSTPRNGLAAPPFVELRALLLGYLLRADPGRKQ
jgi:hypothetical protein